MERARKAPDATERTAGRLLAGLFLSLRQLLFLGSLLGGFLLLFLGVLGFHKEVVGLRIPCAWTARRRFLERKGTEGKWTMLQNRALWLHRTLQERQNHWHNASAPCLMMSMSVLERLFFIGPVRKAIWALWYPFLTRRLQEEDVLFLNYAFRSDPAVNLPLDTADEPHRACIQLYHHVATQVDLQNKDVLEVSCGHGGGASWITRTLKPASYTALDLNPAGIRFCQKRHQVTGLQFIQGDAQKLPFPDQSLDVVINVEASHCYPDFAGFLKEVHRVLRPGGHLLYADFRFRDGFEEWEQAISQAPLNVLQTRDIRDEVLRGMEWNAARSEALVIQRLPRFLHALGRDFAGVPGARVHEALKSRELSYRSWCFRKG